MSDAEREVAAYLQELGLYWKYESPIFVYDEKDSPRVWTPDLYIPKPGMHIEVWGSAERDHTYREDIYKRNDYNVIFVHAYKHHKDWKRFLIKRIMAIEEQRHQPSHENATSTTILKRIQKPHRKLHTKKSTSRFCTTHPAHKHSIQIV